MQAEFVKAGAVMATTAGVAYKVQAVSGSFVATDEVSGLVLDQAGGVIIALGRTRFSVDVWVASGFRVAPVAVGGGGGGGDSYVPNVVVDYEGAYAGESIVIPNGKILVLLGLEGLALADLSGLSPESLGDGVYSTGECYIPAMAVPPSFKWSESLLWIDGQAATGNAPTIAADTTYRLALRKEGEQIFANLTYYNEL